MTDNGFATVCEHIAGMLSLLRQPYARELDRAEPLTSRWVAVAPAHSMATPLLHPGNLEDRPMPGDLSRPPRGSIILDFDEDKPYYLAFGVRAAARQDLRGARLPFASTQPPLIASLSYLRAFEPSREAAQLFASYHTRERRWIGWHGATGQTIRVDAERFDQNVALVLSLQFTRRYDWRVTLGLKDDHGSYRGARMALATNASEARKLFKARELPPGKERRAALRHWVTEHFRRADDAPIAVRSHFRGAERFEWDGLQCEIIPSEYDRDHVGGSPDAK